MAEEEIAALDGNWAEFSPAQRAAFALARKLSYEPQNLRDTDLDLLLPAPSKTWEPEEAEDVERKARTREKMKRKLEAGEKFLAKLPSEYFDSNIRFSSQPMCFPKNPEHFKLLMTLCRGEDWLLYSSDWPHATFDPLNWVFNSPIAEEGRRARSP